MGLFDKSTPEEKAAKKAAAKAELKALVDGAKTSTKEFVAEKKKISAVEYPEATPARLFDAVIQAASSLGYAPELINNETLVASFQTNHGEKRWDGVINAHVIPHGLGAKAQITTRAMKGGFANPAGFSQMASEGAAAMQEGKLKKAIFKVLPSIPERSASGSSAGSSAKSLVEEVKELEKLRQAGILSDEEFAQAKAKLFK